MKNYVSLGDSMTNGYGLPGYNHNSGVADYGEGSYANTFAQWLDANHAQLAMSGIRTEDIHWLLELDYEDPAAIALIDKAVKNLNSWDQVADEWNEFFGCGDYWTVDEIVDHSRINATFAHIAGMTNYETYTGCEDHDCLVEFPSTVEYKGTDYKKYTMAEKIAVVAKYYQEQVAAADVISLSVGNGNLGVFGFGRILEAIGFAETETYLNYNYEDVLRECTPEMKQQLLDMINEIKPMMAGYLPNSELEGVVLYIAASLAMNYAGTLDRILQMNPDAEIILIPVMNTFGDDYATVEGELTIGDLLGLVVDPLNKFIAGLPTYMQVTNNEVYKDAKFYWAELDKSVECFVNTYADGLNDTVRDRFVESIVGYCDCGANHDAADKNPAACRDWEDGMIWGMLGDKVVRITLAEIQAYEKLEDAEKLAYAAKYAEKAMSISMYLAFEKAIIEGKDNPVTLNSVFGLGEILGGNPFGGIMTDFYAQAAIDGASKLDVVAEFLAPQVKAGLEATINEKVSAYLISMGLTAEEAKNYAVTIDVTGEQVAAILMAETTEDKMAAANVIAQNAINAVVKVLGPVYASMTMNGIINGAGENPGLVAVLNGIGAQFGDDFAARYWKHVTADGKDMPDGADQFIEGFYKDSTEGYPVLKDCIGQICPPDAVDAVFNGVAAYINAFAAEAAKIATSEAIAANVNAMLNGMVDTNPDDEIPGDAKAYISNMLIELLGAQEENINSLCTLLVMPETLGDVVANDVKFGGLLALFARCYIGNGIGAHPSEAGHNTLAAAVIAAYENEYTAQDETIENILYIINEYYDEAYAYGYQYALAAGYIDAAIAAIDKAIAELNAIDVDAYEMTDALKAEAQATIDELVETLEAAKALLTEADELDQASMESLLALLNEADDIAVALKNVFVQAGIDTTELVIIPYITNELIPAVKQAVIEIATKAAEHLEAKLTEVAEQLIEAIIEALPTVDAALYNWLYNNPEKVIAFFNEYGDEMLALMEEYGDETLAVIGFVLYNYGEEMAGYVIENHEVILANIVKWADTYGDEVWEMAKVYLDALGILDQLHAAENRVLGEIARLEAAIPGLEAQLVALKAQLEQAIAAGDAALAAQLQTAIEKVEAQIA